MSNDEGEPKTTARLNVNINSQTHEVLRNTMDEYGVSMTEAVRRAVAVYKFFEDCREEGQTIQLVKGNSVTQVRLLLL